MTINNGLWHCDNSYNPAGVWLASDDDNSSGRTATNPILNYDHIYTHVTAPKLMPNSPDGGNYFRFDGVDDGLFAPGAWHDYSNNVSANVSVRWLDLPLATDNFKGILYSTPWKLFLQNDGAEKGILLVRVLNSAGTGFTELQSSVSLDSNVWYNVNFEVFNNILRLSVNDNTATTPLIGGMQNTNSAVFAGTDGTSSHYFEGDLDEIRFGAVIPEPGILWIVGLLELWIIGRKKFN